MPAARDLDADWLEDFLCALRDEGFRIDGRHFAAAQLMLGRAVAENLPPQRLRNLLTPIVAHSPSEQSRFHTLFDAAIPSGERRTDRRAAQIAEEERTTRWRALAAGLFSVAVLSFGVWAVSELGRDPDRDVTEIIVEPPPPVVIGGVEMELSDEPLPENPDEISITVYEPQEDPAKRNALTALPVAAFLGYLVWRRLRRRSWIGRGFGKSRPVRSHPANNRLFARRGFRRAAQNMRRHRAEPTTQLDVPATVKATVDACGQFTPVMATRAATPEYLALIERFHRDDHVTRLAVAATDRLRAEGVAVERYFFGYDPRICRDDSGAAITLDRLAERARDRRLVIVGEAEGFSDPLTEAPEPWTDRLSVWPDRTLFSARRIRAWGSAETGLLEDGLNLATATPGGIAAYAELPDEIGASESGILLEGRRAPPEERADPSVVIEPITADEGCDVAGATNEPAAIPLWVAAMAAGLVATAALVLITYIMQPEPTAPPLAEDPPDIRRVDLETFRDCPDCPEMVVIPAGDFLMGAPESEAGRISDEGPQREVSVARFAMGRTEVTFDQWRACVDGGGCQGNPEPGDAGWGRGDRPVINVSWDDAQEYVAWLNGKVDGAPYRLPSEAEWEYGARAGTVTPYWWGGQASHEYANYGADECCSGLAEGRDQWINTAPVASFPANAFGLSDTSGNVWEWVEDCYADNYADAPTDGAPYIPQKSCSLRVLRGGSWVNSPWDLRSANRNWFDPGNRSGYVGFRLARTLTP